MGVLNAIDLRLGSTYTDQDLPEPLVTKVVRMPLDGLQFPLKKDYDRCNQGINWLGELLEPRAVEGEESQQIPCIGRERRARPTGRA